MNDINKRLNRKSPDPFEPRQTPVTTSTLLQIKQVITQTNTHIPPCGIIDSSNLIFQSEEVYFTYSFYLCPNSKH